MRYLVGLSGGKDSTAVMLWVIHESAYPPESVEFVFSPTGLEAPVTLQYIDFLSGHIQNAGYAPIRHILPPMDFFQLAEHKHRFPSRKAQFCTDHLKIRPLRAYIATIPDQVISISGTRADESTARAELPERAFDKAGHQVFRPILTWSEADVFAYLQKYHIPRNPLYDLGFKRVGCLPCINSRKQELHLLATHFPEIITRIRNAEHRLGVSFYARTFVPATHRTWHAEYKGKAWLLPSIDDAVRWSFTARGGKQYALPPDLATLAALNALHDQHANPEP